MSDDTVSAQALAGQAMPDEPMQKEPMPEELKLDNQLCFPLYAASRLVTRLYKERLEPLGITYPQYIVLMILWEEAPCPVKTVSRRAILNTNTLTPLLKRLEQQGYITRQRDGRDERQVMVHLSMAGKSLRDRCACVPWELLESSGVALDKLIALRDMLNEVLPDLKRSLEGE